MAYVNSILIIDQVMVFIARVMHSNSMVAFVFQLIKLPRHPTVDDILKKYLEFKTKQEGV